MLVLSRKRRQSVVVEGCGPAGEMLTVTVLEIRGTRVRLGFEVAEEVPVHRLEVWELQNGLRSNNVESTEAGLGNARS